MRFRRPSGVFFSIQHGPGLPALGVLLSALLTYPGLGVAQHAEPPEQEVGSIHGIVFGQRGTRSLPLPNAIVHVSAGPRHFTASTDSGGRYSLVGLRPGPWRIRAVHVGYRDMSLGVQVPPAGAVALDLSLRWEPVRLPPILVEADPVRPLRPSSPPPTSELGEVAIRALEGTSGIVEGGLAQVVRSIPGNDPSDPQDVLLMRGSASDLKLVLLDGAPVYTPFHMAGLVESFEPQSLSRASLFLGGAPARYDGGLSYILDLQGRSADPEGFRGNAALDLMTGRILLEGPLAPSTGLLVAGRAIHNLGTPLLGQGSSPYGFGDVLSRLEWNGDDGERAFVTGFWNRESVVLDLSADADEALAEEAELGNFGLLGSPPAGDGARWGNRALAAGYTGWLGETRAELRIAASRYEAELPLGDTVPLFAQSRSDRVRVAADLSRTAGQGILRFGANLDRVNSAYSALSLDPVRVGQDNRVDLDGITGGVYLEFSRPLSGSVSLRAGGRLDRFQGERALRLAPRLSLVWMLTDQAALTLAGGRYHQYSNVASGQIEKNLGPGSPGGAQDEPFPLELSVGSADHLVVSLDQSLTPELRLGLEGFVKKFSGVAGTAENSLNASGVDLRVARDGPRTSGWLGYTLTWFWASDGLLTGDNSPFSGRHLLSAGLTTSLTERAGLRLRASYGDGLPFTSVPVFGEDIQVPSYDANEMVDVRGDQVLNAAPDLTVGPDEGFLRLEVELYGSWSPTFSGRTMQLRPYLRVLNALNRRDALFYHFEPWRSEGPEPLADLPVLPLLGLEWRF